MKFANIQHISSPDVLAVHFTMFTVVSVRVSIEPNDHLHFLGKRRDSLGSATADLIEVIICAFSCPTTYCNFRIKDIFLNLISPFTILFTK